MTKCREFQKIYRSSECILPKKRAPVHVFENASFAIAWPHKPRLAHHMVYGHIAPVSGIEGIMTAIAYHPDRGRVEIIPFVTGYSTTSIIDRIKSL